MGPTRRCLIAGSGDRGGVFIRGMEGLPAAQTERRVVMIDATYLKAHRTASGLGVKYRGLWQLIGHTKSEMNTRLDAVTDAQGHPISLFVTAGWVPDTGSRAPFVRLRSSRRMPG